jgi:hypothetical protein
MQVLDQEVGAALALPEQARNLGKRGRVDLAALWVIGPTPPPGPGMDAPVVS